MSPKLGFASLSMFVAVFAVATTVQAQSGLHTAVRLTRGINESQLVTRAGSVHPAVYSATDLGRVSDGQLYEHMLLQLKRSPADQAALDEFLNSQQDRNSPNFHKWLTAAQYEQQWGVAQQDIDTVTRWLESRGFTVNAVYPNMVVDFSGTAKQVRETFHTEIHNLDMSGEHHIANVSNVQIPAELAEVVAGPVRLNDFKPKALVRMRPQGERPDYTISSSRQVVVPADLQTIYNFNPVYAAGVSGQGQTVVLLERTDLYSNGDWNTFRKTLGLSRRYPQGKLITVHPQPNLANINNGGTCSDPGVLVGDDTEAAVDVEWSSAAAPNATIELASCKDTQFNFGFLIALQNLITQTTPSPAVMSLSYGAWESEFGTDGNLYIYELYELAEAQGVSLFVSTGDSGADVTDGNKNFASHGINVNALASTPWNVAVGGTDYADSFLGENAIYWNGTNNPSTYESARSYVPEIPWNNSCASQLITIALGFSVPYGAGGSCNNPPGSASFLSTAAGSGGPSGCASGFPTVAGVVNGTCEGYPKPGFQTFVAGNPSDGVRDLPDVSMFAANGVWGHSFVLCYTNTAGGGTANCLGNPSTWNGAGGTSFGAPIWAGIQALINQASSSSWGNPDFFYYLLAGLQYPSAACNSTLGNAVNSGCIFHDITLGDMSVNCRVLTSGTTTIGTFNCYLPDSAINGVLSVSNTSYQPAYAAGIGWDFATGIGTPNVLNLVTAFAGP